MKFPKEAITEAARFQAALELAGTAGEDHKPFISEYISENRLDELVQYCELANAKLAELQAALTKHQLAIHRVQHALKDG